MKSYMEHWVQPIKYIFVNPDLPTRRERRHSKRKKRCDGNGSLTIGRF